MTTPAVRQFIAICGGQQVAKGAAYVEPLAKCPREAFIIGQTDYLAVSVLYGDSEAGWQLPNPFPLHTHEAALWSEGRYHERRVERSVIEAYAHIGRLA